MFSNFVGCVAGPGNLYLLQKVQTISRTQQTFYRVSAAGVKWLGCEWVGICF